MGLISQYLFRDFWVPVWPNLAAAVLCAIHITRSNIKHGYLGKKAGKG